MCRWLMRIASCRRGNLQQVTNTWIPEPLRSGAPVNSDYGIMGQPYYVLHVRVMVTSPMFLNNNPINLQPLSHWF